MIKAIFTYKEMFPYGHCPKCSCAVLGGGQKAQDEHNKNCKSTAIEDGAKKISDLIDKMISDKFKPKPITRIQITEKALIKSDDIKEQL